MRIQGNHPRRPALHADRVPGEVLLRLKEGKDSVSSELLDDYALNVVERFDLDDSISTESDSDQILRIKLPKGAKFEDAFSELQQDERIDFVEPNYRIQLPNPEQQEQTELPDDLTSKLWGLHNDGQSGGKAGADISAKEAWAITQGDRSAQGPVIAVIDTGIDYQHPDLAANMWTNPGEIPGDGIDNDQNGVIDDVYGYNAYLDNGDPMDGHSHGTHCAGTIGAVGGNGIGVVGVSPQAKLMAVKIFSDKGASTSASILRGILYANKMGADITSNSWGGGPYNQAVKDAFNASEALHIVAAGNDKYDNDKADYYPANYEVDNMVVVAATDRRDQRAGFSQWGATKVDVAAPGKDIWSTVPDGKYASYSGTSMATPHVSGVAALIASEYPEASAQDIKDRIIYGSDKVHKLHDISVSDGRVNAAASLENDLKSPGSPGEVKVVKTGYRGPTLTWTSPAEDGTLGSASTVELRLSSEPITQENFRQATPYLSKAAEVVGKKHSYTLELPPSVDAREVYLSIQGVDNVGNRSPLSTTGKLRIPSAEILLEESFQKRKNRFQMSGSFRHHKDPEKGQVVTSAPPRGKRATRVSTLTSPRIDLRKNKAPFLQFEMKTDIAVANSASLEVSTDGKRWRQVEKFQNADGWKEHGIDLSAYEGKKIQLRFSVKSRIGRAKNGISLSKLQVFGEGN